VNSFVAYYKKYLQDTGQKDDLTDYQITKEMGDWANKNDPKLFEEHPDFAEEWASIREANAPPLSSEVGRGFKRAGIGLGSTALGAGALVTGSDYLKRKAAALDLMASDPDLAPTIGTMDDVRSGRDALRYGLSKFGEAAPSIAESVAVAGVGALAGSAAAPGAGTIAGGVAGVLEKSAIKAALREMLKKGAKEEAESIAEGMVKKKLLREASEEGIEEAVKAGVKPVIDAVASNAKRISTIRGGIAANTANSYGLSAGEIYNETDDRGLALGLGAVAAVPDTILPAYLLTRMFPGVAMSEARKQGKNLVARLATEGLKTSGIEASTEAFQEGVNIVAKKLKDGTDPTDFNDQDWVRVREAAITGAAGGALTAPAAAIGGRAPEVDVAAPAVVVPPAKPAVASPVVEPTAPEAISPVRRVMAMSPEQQAVRVTELESREMVGDEPQEYQLLKQVAPTATPTEEVIQPTAPNEQIVQPAPVEPSIPINEAVVGQASAAPRASAPTQQAEIAGAVLPGVAGEGANVGQLPVSAVTATSIAPVEFVGVQEGADGKPLFTIYRTTEDIPGHPKGSSVTDKTLAQAGYDVAALPTEPPVVAPPTPFVPSSPVPVVPALMPTSPPPQQLASVAGSAPNIGSGVETAPTAAPVGLSPREELSKLINETQTAAGWDPQWPFIPQDFGNKTFVEGVIADQTIAPELKKRMFDAARKLGVGTIPENASTAPLSQSQPIPANVSPSNQEFALPQGTAATVSADASIRGGSSASPAMADRGGSSVAGVLGVVERGGGQVASALGQKITSVFALPRALAGAKPRFSAFQLNFESDLDKATYILAQPNPSASDGAYLKAVTSQTGMTEQQARQRGREVKARIKEIVNSGGDGGDVVNVPATDSEFDAPAMRFSTEPANPAVQASRTKEFQAVMGRLVSNGANVQTMSQELLAQQTGDMLRQQIAALEQRLAQATTAPQRDEITRQLEFRKQRLSEIGQMQGVTYSPYHIAVAMKDVMSANVHELVTLIHEAAESLTMRLTPAQQGAVMRAVEATFADMHSRMQAAAQNTGATVAHVPNPSELLAESMAQKFAAEGVPESKSLADAIVRWIKEIYYRVAMAAQRAFGAEPNPELAIAWFENQLRRELGGDYSYSLESLLDRLMPQSNETIAKKLTGLTGTPDGLVDFYDPVTESLRQPMAEPISSDALAWNMKFSTTQPNAGESLGIPAEEAYARTAAAAYNEQVRWMEEMRLKVAPKMNPAEFYAITGYGQESPQELLAALETQSPGVSSAKIGGERMTDIMNKQASYQVLQFVRGMQAKHLDSIAKTQETVADAEEKYTKHAGELNRLEPDVRNAEIHEGVLKDKAKEMLTDLLKSYKDGIRTAKGLGGMMRTEEGLGEYDPMPKFYEQVFNSLLNGDIELFKYVDAIAALDLPLSTMSPDAVLKAVRDNADQSPALKELSRNKPLALTLATLASDSSRQFDQVQLRKAEGSAFLEIRKDLEAIRNATEAQLREMIKTVDDRALAKGLRQRIKHEYLLERRALRLASDRMAEAEKRIKLLTEAKPEVAARVAEAEQAIGGIFTDWQPINGAEFIVMRKRDDGSYAKAVRKLVENSDGSFADSEGIYNDLKKNTQWLKANKEREGQKEYNQIKHQTDKLKILDIGRSYQAANFGKIMGFIDSFVRPLQAIAKQAGGSGSRIVQAFNQYVFINRSGEKALIPGSHRWQHAMNRAMKSAGIKDIGQFKAQVYNPVMYYLGVNPGLDQYQAIREATKEARNRLAKEPAADFNEKFEKFLIETKAINEEMLRTAEQYGVMVSDPKIQGELRRALAQGWITGMRGMNDGVVVTLINEMGKAGWKMEYDGEGKKRRATHSTTFRGMIPPALKADESNADARAEYFAQLENTEVVRGALKPFFTPRIVNDWLLPFINKAGKAVFTHDGNNIPQIALQNAWAKSGGDVLNWIDELGMSIDMKPAQGVSNSATFRAEMLEQIESLYAWEARMAFESQKTPDLFNNSGAKLHVMMDARMNDTLPPEHVNFASYDPTSVQQLLGQIAFHGAFGRNGQALTANLGELANTLKLKKANFDSLQSSTVDGREREAKERGWNYNDLKNGVKHWQDVEELRGEIESAFGINNTYGPLHDARAGLELLGFVVGQAVDQPKTAGLNFLSLGARAFAMHSLGFKVIKATALSYGELAKNSFGGMLHDFGIDIIRMSDYAKEAGEVEGKAFRRLPWGVVMSDMGKEGSFQDGLAQRFLVHPLRVLKAIQKKGVGPGLLSIPGAGIMQRFATEGAIANLRGQTYLLEGIINAGIKHFAAHPEDLNNPAFRFDADKLKMRMDRGVYDWFRNKTVEYNMGPIENIVRESMERMKTGDRVITKEMVEQLAQMNGQELDGASSINTAPAGLANNPALKVAMPLLRWPLWMMHAAHEGLADANGKADFKSMMKGIGRLAAWNLPLGLAFTFLIDEYDEKILGKKNAMPEAQGVGAIPFIGLPLALATTNRGIPQEAIAIGQRMIRSGNVYGLGADMLGALVTPFDPGSGQRAFSLDQRVMVMSQFLNLTQAISNMVSQGGTATWGSVYRPMVASIGGNGMLNSLGIVNNMVGLDNQEARLTMRINAARWINTAAKEVGIETKKASGFSNPSPMSVWTREMQLAAMANDRMGFGQAYQKALAAAREIVSKNESIPVERREQEAMQRVLASWKARNPFSGLASTPTPDQIAQLLGAMDEDGRKDVSDAMRQFQSYTALIAPSKTDQLYARRLNTLRQQANPMLQVERMRRQAAGMFAQ